MADYVTLPLCSGRRMGSGFVCTGKAPDTCESAGKLVSVIRWNSPLGQSADFSSVQIIDDWRDDYPIESLECFALLHAAEHGFSVAL